MIRPDMRRLRNVRLFKSGVWKGDRYTNGQLDEAVENFRRFQAPGPKRLQRAPLIVGHGPEDLDDDRIPKRGDILSLRREGNWLVAPEMDADDDLANAIEAGNYDDLSAELYPSPPEGVPGKGMMLRRVAILGGDIPHIKGLNPEGLAAKLHSEGRRRVKIVRFSQQGGVCRVFSEDRAMDRDAMMTALVGAGMSHEVVEGMDDTQLTEACKLLPQAGGGETTPPPPPENANAFAEDDRPAADAKMQKMAACYKEKFGEDPSMMTQPMQQFTESDRADIVRFCETYKDRIDPAQLDESAGTPTLIDFALALDNSKRVHKFTEGGTTKSASMRDAFLRSIRTSRIRYGAEKIKGGTAGPVIFSEGATKKDRFKAFAEQKSDVLKKMSMTPDEMVKAWDAGNDSQKSEFERGIGFAG